MTGIIIPKLSRGVSNMSVKGIVVGKRIPVGAVVGGICTAAFSLWNKFNPDMEFSVAEAGGFNIALVGLTQIVVVNLFGVTAKSDD